MQITQVTTVVDDLDQAERFYTELELSSGRSQGVLEVQIGSTVLRLEHLPDSRSCDHLAFDIPSAGFDSAKRWLQARMPLLERDGLDQFEGPPSWNSTSLYFSGPSNSVLELIARRDIAGDAVGDVFDSGQILRISEVGVATTSVRQAFEVLTEHPDLQSFGGAPGDTFAPIGDEYGLLILASIGRAWAPTADRFATAAPLSVVATGTRAGHLQIDRAVIEINVDSELERHSGGAPSRTSS